VKTDSLGETRFINAIHVLQLMHEIVSILSLLLTQKSLIKTKLLVT
jgi:hypothetical protein